MIKHQRFCSKVFTSVVSARSRVSLTGSLSIASQWYSTTTSTTATNKEKNKSANASKRMSLVHENEALDFANRKANLLTKPIDLYPSLSLLSFDSNITGYQAVRIPEFRSKYGPQLSGDEKSNGGDPLPDLITVQGRVSKIRKSGKGLLFYDLIQDSTKLQAVINQKKLVNSSFNKEEEEQTEQQNLIDIEKFINLHSYFRRGDIVSISGKPWKTPRGELSLLADHPATLLSPCFHPIPLKALNQDSAATKHNRVVNFLSSKEARYVIVMRSQILQYIRNFFFNKGFLEVQTPTLSNNATGATARPFLTELNFSGTQNSTGVEVEEKEEKEKLKLALRIAPELWLKRLIVSGFDKIFEIGQCYRNEGLDTTHNPEFTSCEFYQSYTNLDGLVDITQTFLRGLVDNLVEIAKKSRGDYSETAGTTTAFQNLVECPDPIFENLLQIQKAFSKDFIKLDFVKDIETATGKPLPKDLSDYDKILEYAKTVGAMSSSSSSSVPPPTLAKVLDNLAAKYLETQSQGHYTPVLIVNHPTEMSALAKSVENSGRTLSRRFELFINGKEYINAYEEENSPVEQLKKFELQQQSSSGTVRDEETPLPDYSYVETLEWGLPPTGGWGLGIDRLCMLMSNSKSIEQVLSFGSVKTVNYQ